MNFDDEIFDDATSSPAEKSWVGWIFAGLLIVTALSFAGYWLYAQNSDAARTEVSKGGIPILKADRTPTKRLPKNAGGMKVPFQDKLVYERVEKGAIIKVKERLLPTPEEPMRAGERFAKLLAQTAAAKKREQKAKKLLIPKKPKPKPKVTATDAKNDEKLATRQSKKIEKSPAKNVDVTAEKSVNPKKKKVKVKNHRKENEIAAKIPEKPSIKSSVVNKQPSAKKEPIKSKPKSVKVVKITPNKPATKSVPKTRPAAGKYTVQIAAFRSRENAERGWRALIKKHRITLARQRHSVVKVTLKKKGVYFRLRAGNFAKRAGAQALCRRLKAVRQSCITVTR